MSGAPLHDSPFLPSINVCLQVVDWRVRDILRLAATCTTLRAHVLHRDGEAVLMLKRRYQLALGLRHLPRALDAPELLARIRTRLCRECLQPSRAIARARATRRPVIVCVDCSRAGEYSQPWDWRRSRRDNERREWRVRQRDLPEMMRPAFARCGGNRARLFWRCHAEQLFDLATIARGGSR